ncbi:hypothetical protein [Photobacterium leiognathi]|uniref:hypothetical protein n=1 Tax=Photobacterium leiognathi TaxID=553611 RepID=UPI003AF39FCA
MNILFIGGWFSGNSAILDYIDKFKNIKYIKSDFDILRETGGIMDMILLVDKAQKNNKIYNIIYDCIFNIFKEIKFIVGKYTKNIFKNKDFHEKREYKKRYNDSVFFNLSLIWCLIKYYFKINYNNINVDCEILFWNNWLKNKNKKINQVYCNPIYYDNFEITHKDLWPKLFTPYKIILVHRDPFDQFCDIYLKGGMSDTSVKRFFGGTEDLNLVERFTYIVNKVHQARIDLIKSYDKDEVLLISFEDFVSGDIECFNELKCFLNLSQNDNLNQFYTGESKKNIGIWKSNEEVKNIIKSNESVFDELIAMRKELISTYRNKRSY